MYKKALKSLLTVIVAVTPIIYVNNTNELYEFPKMLFVYILGATLIFIFLAHKNLKSLTRDKFNKPLLAFLAIYVLATLFSMHFYTSLWGYYTRFNGGLISILIYFGIYLVAKTELSKNDLKQVFFFATLTTIPIGIYAVMQHFPAFDGIWGGKSIDRVYSTIGQPNWLAAYISMLFPFCLFFYTKAETIKNRGFWLFTCLLAFSTIWFTYSMSGLLALLVSTTAFIVLNKTPLKKLTVLLVLSFIIAITNLGIFQNKVNDIFTDLKKQISYVTKVYAQTENQLSDPGFIRISLWEGTIKLITFQPKILLIGTGPETFPYAFQQFRPRSLNYSSEWDFVFNKPHNYFLELASTIGFIGSLLYVVVLALAIKKKHKIITPALIAFAITNFFGWPTVSTNILFFIYLAYVDKND